MPTTRHLILALATLLAVTFEARATVPGGYTQTTLASGLQRPVALAYTPDGRLLVGEQFTGRILVVKNGSLLATPFARLFPVFANSNETGLIGLAVDPQFATNGWVYALVTETSSVQKVYRFTAQGDIGTAPTAIVPNLPTAGINHNGGGIGFGPDGKLYVSIGDNGSFPNDSQSTTSRRGKLLRFNKDGTVAPGNPYGATNPAFCIGLRNTYRFCFQPGTGRIFATENGPNGYDEINVLEAGKNYGWPNVTGVNGDPRWTDPIVEFPRTIAPTGITFYRGTAMAALTGKLLFASYRDDKVMRATIGAAGTAPAISDFVTNVSGPVDVAEGPDGSIAICTLAGGLYLVTAAAAPANQLPSAAFTFTPRSGAAPLAVSFDGSGSSDPDGTIASYAWSFGDGATATGARPAAHSYALAGTYQATLTVTDNRGGTGRTTQAVVITSSGGHGSGPASAHIEQPADGSSHGGLTVAFEGHGHAGGQIVEQDWSFGDGSAHAFFQNPGSDVNKTTIHTFPRAGTYSISLTVEDDLGQTDTDTIQVTVGTGIGGGGVVATFAAQRFEWQSAYLYRSGGTYGQYVLRLDAGVAYEIATSGTAAGTSDDPYLYLRDGGTDAIVAQDDDSAGGRDSKIVFTPPATGDYKVRVRAYNRGTSGTTTITVRSQGGGTQPTTPAPALRPGDVLTGQSFEWRASFAGRQEGSYGEYRLSAVGGRRYVIETASAVGGGADTFLYLLDAQGQVIAQDDDSAGSYLSRITWMAPTTGEYVVRLRAYGRGAVGTCTLRCTAMP